MQASSLLGGSNPLQGWLSDSNKSLALALVSDPDNIQEFYPEFTYPVFGEEEKIFGYKNPSVKLYYSAGSLMPYFHFDYSSQISDSKIIGLKGQDVFGMLQEKLPPTVLFNLDEFKSTVKKDQFSFIPPGHKVHEYQLESSTVELYSCNFKTARFKDFHRRLQTFLLWYIEGASFVEDDDNWEFIVSYERTESSEGVEYRVLGYTSYYPFFHFPDQTRVRISQFLILPPYQNQGHGSRLYKYLYQFFLKDAKVVDVTVEDPNDDFQVMRDRCDLKAMLEHNISLPPLTDSAIMYGCPYKSLQTKWKLGSRQAARVFELLLLKKSNRLDKKVYKRYRLMVKQRLYRKNRDALTSMDSFEVKRVLAETYDRIEQDYVDTIAKLS